MIRAFTKDSLINGRSASIECLEMAGQTYSISRGAAVVVRLEDEWYEDVRDPEAVITALKDASMPADIFTFWQRLPDTQPQFGYHHEWESIAVLPVVSYEHWWNKQVKPATRNLVRKSLKKGVEVRECAYDDAFIRGITEIFNETPVRQGRRFWHYGKDFETVKRQFSRYLFRETLIGAYCEGELIGFVMLGNAGRYAAVGQIISKIGHRDKSPNNALLAKAVEICAEQELPHLVYAYWADGSLLDFKRHNGFEQAQLPRYYVPITSRGRLALNTGLHRGWTNILPAPFKNRLKSVRSRWFSRLDASGIRSPR